MHIFFNAYINTYCNVQESPKSEYLNLETYQLKSSCSINANSEDKDLKLI